LSEPPTLGVDEIGLVPRDIEAGRKFSCEARGYKIAGRNHDHLAHSSSHQTLITVRHLAAPASSTPFHRFSNAGLPHLAFEVIIDAQLEGRMRAYEFKPQ
jgi:catechol 2,3-dioxygenase-like lactoylglutathione lyase family enzyme